MKKKITSKLKAVVAGFLALALGLSAPAVTQAATSDTQGEAVAWNEAAQDEVSGQEASSSCLPDGGFDRAPEILVLHAVEANPAYADEIDVSDLAIRTPEEQALDAAYARYRENPLSVTAAEKLQEASEQVISEDAPVCTSVEAAAAAILQQYRERREKIEISLRFDLTPADRIYEEIADIDAAFNERLSLLRTDTSLSDEEKTEQERALKDEWRDRQFVTFYRYLWRTALNHNPADSTAGDYSAYLYGGFGTDFTGTLGDTHCEGNLYYRMYAVNKNGEKTRDYYYTTLAQEETLTERLAALTPTLYKADDPDEKKVRAIYDYICSHVAYDHTGSTGYQRYSAYGALVNGTSVCQGYAGLLYRMSLEAGVDARIISGYGMGGNHAWNALHPDGAWYLGDSTWDAGMTAYGFYLKGSEHFTGHTPNHANERVTDGGHTIGARPNYFNEESCPISTDDYDAVYPVRYSGVTADERYSTSYSVRNPIVTFPRPQKTGYTFAGWYTDSTCTKEVKQAVYDEATGLYTFRAEGLRGELLLVAKFVPGTVTVRFFADEGQSSPAAEQSFTLRVPQALTKAKNILKNRFPGTGDRRFKGWRAADGSPYAGRSFTDGEIVTFIESVSSGDASLGTSLTEFSTMSKDTTDNDSSAGTSLGTSLTEFSTMSKDATDNDSSADTSHETSLIISEKTPGISSVSGNDAIVTDGEGKVLPLDLVPVWDSRFLVTLRIPEDVVVADPGAFSCAPLLSENKYLCAYRTASEKLALPKVVRKDNYRFAGWKNAATGKTVTAVTVNGDVILTPVFEPYKTKITYVLNKPAGSSISATAPAAQTIYGGADFTAAPLAVTGTHRFLGWSTSKTGGTVYEPGDVVKQSTPLTSDQKMTLYGQWEAKTYRIDYRIWDTDEAIAAASPFTYPCGTAHSLKNVTPQTLGYTARTDGQVYRFLGWYTATDESALGKKVTAVPASNTEDLTLYAVYDIAYDVVLDDAAAGKSTTLTGFRTGKTGKVKKLSAIGWAAPAGKVFTGWSVSGGDVHSDAVICADGGTLSFGKTREETKYTFLETQDGRPVLPLTAVYVDVPTAEQRSRTLVRFYADGELHSIAERRTDGTEAAALSALKHLHPDTHVVIPAIPVKTGYRFSYWKDRHTGKKVTTLAKNDFRPVIELTAVFTPKKIAVTCSNNFDRLPAGTKGKAQTVTTKISYTAKQLKKNTWKFTGFTFAGWALTPAGAPVTDEKGKLSDTGAYRTKLGSKTAITLYAVWTPVIYTYHYDDCADAEGADDFDASCAQSLSAHQGSLRVPPAREGLCFVGWYRYRTDSKGRLVPDKNGRPVKTGKAFTAAQPSDQYLYAVWEVNR